MMDKIAELKRKQNSGYRFFFKMGVIPPFRKLVIFSFLFVVLILRHMTIFIMATPALSIHDQALILHTHATGVKPITSGLPQGECSLPTFTIVLFHWPQIRFAYAACLIYNLQDMFAERMNDKSLRNEKSLKSECTKTIRKHIIRKNVYC